MKSASLEKKARYARSWAARVVAQLRESSTRATEETLAQFHISADDLVIILANGDPFWNVFKREMHKRAKHPGSTAKGHCNVPPQVYTIVDMISDEERKVQTNDWKMLLTAAKNRRTLEERWIIGEVRPEAKPEGSTSTASAALAEWILGKHTGCYPWKGGRLDAIHQGSFGDAQESAEE